MQLVRQAEIIDLSPQIYAFLSIGAQPESSPCSRSARAAHRTAQLFICMSYRAKPLKITIQCMEVQGVHVRCSHPSL